MARSTNQDLADLLAALHVGHFNSSQGPEFIEMKPLEGGAILAVRTSPVRALHLTGREAFQSIVTEDPDSTTAELSLEAIKGPYAGLTSIDRHGHRTWTSPIGP